MTQPTVRMELRNAVGILADAGCTEPEKDAVTLLAAIIECDPRDVLDRASEPFPGAGLQALHAHIARRAAREPIEYITGWARFRGLRIAVDPRVLVPEAQSGPLVDYALNLPCAARVHDVGTGSGAIALSIKNERLDLLVTGSDISSDAIAVAHENGKRLNLGVGWSVADGVPSGAYDLVVGTLPYGDIAAVAVHCPPEAYHQPDLANFGGVIGPETICHVVSTIETGTLVVLQHAPYQTEIVRSLLRDADTFGPLQYPARFTAGRVV